MSGMKGKINHLGHDEVYFFAAMCMFLSGIEYAIPKPLPFLRLGLANLPLLMALRYFCLKDLIILCSLKVIFQAVISGTLLSYVFVFSICGTFSSFIAMYLVHLIFGERVSLVGISLSGSMANCIMQVLLSYLMLFGKNAFYIAPLLLAFGFVTGILLGLTGNIFMGNSRWISLVDECCFSRKAEVRIREETSSSLGAEDVPRRKASGFVLRCVGGCLGMVIISFCSKVAVIWSIVLLYFILACVLKGGKIKVLPSLLIVAGIVGSECLITNGRVLFSIFSWKITLGSVLRGLLKSGRLVGMVFISQVLLSGDIGMDGRIGNAFRFIKRAFNSISGTSLELKKGNLFKRIDERFCEAWMETFIFRVQNCEDGDSL